MSSDLYSAMNAAATGMRAQTVRIRIASENVANANSTGQTPGEDPYRRRAPVFEDYLNREMGVMSVRVTGAQEIMSPFPTKYDPAHPAADANGYVKMPNVQTLIEMADIREAQRAYEANLNVIDSSRQMMTRALDLLKR